MMLYLHSQMTNSLIECSIKSCVGNWKLFICTSGAEDRAEPNTSLVNPCELQN